MNFIRALICFVVYIFIGNISSQAQNMQPNQKQVLDLLNSYINRIIDRDLNLEVREYYIDLALNLCINGGDEYEEYVEENISTIKRTGTKVQIASQYHKGIKIKKVKRFLQDLLHAPVKVKVDGASFFMIEKVPLKLNEQNKYIVPINAKDYCVGEKNGVPYVDYSYSKRVLYLNKNYVDNLFAENSYLALLDCIYCTIY